MRLKSEVDYDLMKAREGLDRAKIDNDDKMYEYYNNRISELHSEYRSIIDCEQNQHLVDAKESLQQEERKRREKEKKELEKKQMERDFKSLKDHYKGLSSFERLSRLLKGTKPNWRKIQGKFTSQELSFILKVSEGRSLDQKKLYSDWERRNDKLVDGDSRKKTYAQMKEMYKKDSLAKMALLLNDRSYLELCMNSEYGKSR